MARERTVYVLATGPRTPLGIGSARSAAAVRAGISAMTERALLVDRPWTLRQVALDPELNLRLTGTDRLLSLAAEACSEASEPLERWQKHDRKLAVFLGLPEYRPGFAEPDVQVFRTHLHVRFGESGPVLRKAKEDGQLPVVLLPALERLASLGTRLCGE